MVTITNDGVEEVARKINGVSPEAAFTYMATGSGSTAELVTQGALTTENTLNGSARAAATCTYEATGISKWVKTFNFTGAVTLREIGIFTAASAGTMFCRHVLVADKVYANGESVEITITNTTARSA